MKSMLLSWTAVCGLTSALLLSGCHKEPAAPGTVPLPAASVRVQAVESKPYLASEEVVGTVRAKLRASVEAKINARIEQMLVAPGQVVKKGDMLAQLDAREIEARLEQAKAVREQAEQDRKRFASLLQDKAVTQQEFDAVQARYRVAAAAVTEAETMLGYAKVTAPFDGVVSRKLADVGDLATPGRSLLEVEDPAFLRLEADVPEALIGRVQLGAKLAVRVAALPKELEGTVGEIAPVSDANSRTFRVKLDLPSAANLRAGQFGRVAVPLGETMTLRVAQAAVVQRGQLEIVFVVAEQRGQLRLVKTGKRFAGEVELLSGVSPGESVVVEGAAALRDGQPVQLKP